MVRILHQSKQYFNVSLRWIWKKNEFFSSVAFSSVQRRSSFWSKCNANMVSMTSVCVCVMCRDQWHGDFIECQMHCIPYLTMSCHNYLAKGWKKRPPERTTRFQLMCRRVFFCYFISNYFRIPVYSKCKHVLCSWLLINNNWREWTCLRCGEYNQKHNWPFLEPYFLPLVFPFTFTLFLSPSLGNYKRLIFMK